MTPTFSEFAELMWESYKMCKSKTKSEVLDKCGPLSSGVYERHLNFCSIQSRPNSNCPLPQSAGARVTLIRGCTAGGRLAGVTGSDIDKAGDGWLPTPRAAPGL